MARQKKVLLQEVTREAAEEAFSNYNQIISRLSIIEGRMNEEITKVKARHEDRIGELQSQRDEQFDMLQAYAESNPELFEKKKSLEFTHGVIGFRTGTPKLKTLKGFTWEAVKTLVKKVLPTYIRTEEAVAKDLLLANREKEEVKNVMKDIGLMVDQDESFYVAPKLEDVVAV